MSTKHFDSALVCSLTIWSFLCVKRYRKSDPTVLQDVCICVTIELWILFSQKAGAFHNDFQRAVLFSHVLIAVAGLLVSLLFINSGKSRSGSVATHSERATVHGARPLIFPSRTTHSRFTPRKHSFSYSYLLVSIPVGFHGTVNNLLSVDTFKRLSLFSVDATDFLSRDYRATSLREKLDQYLGQQHTDPDDYPIVYLVTAPRVLGYSFNPASFWYLYNAAQELTAMIVEVNNTFDERRLYFLKSNDTASTKVPKVFTSRWKKDFHVSPFNSREGAYSLVARDIVPQGQAYEQIISNTITLSSPDDQPKIVARIFSTDSPIDPATLGTFSVLRLLFKFGWIGFLTFPRIINEARKLYFWKKLAVWYRPEVRQSSIGRSSTQIERDLAKFFRLYLQQAVEYSNLPISVRYSAPYDIEGSREHSFSSKTANTEETPVVDVQVLSPAFYSRFVHYAHVSEAFDTECFCTKDENQTVRISRPDIFRELIEKGLTKPSMEWPGLGSLGRIDQLRWKALRMLRCPPGQQSYPFTADSSLSGGQDIRYFPLSQLDTFVMRHCSKAWLYRRRVCQLFIARRLALGFETIPKTLDQLFRFGIAAAGIYSSRQLTIGREQDSRVRWGVFFPAQVFTICIIHVWALVKGM